VITTASLADGVVSAGYSQQLQATGGTGSYSWSRSAGDIPPGLTLSAAGLISGAPVSAGTWSFTVRAVSGNKSAEKQLSITVAAGPVSIDTGTLPGGLVGVAYNQSLAASGGAGPGTFTWTVTGGSLPGGLNLSAGGAITGSPNATGTFNFTVQASSGAFSNTRALTIVVEQPVSITTPSLPSGTAGTAYSQTLTAGGGTGAYTWSIASGSPPNGVTLSSGGVLSGTPAAAGNYTFTVRATSTTMSSNTATRQYTLTVQPAAVTGIMLNVGDSPTATVTVNNTLSIPIAVDMSGRAPGENLASLQVNVSWDPAKFDYVSSSQGSWQDDSGGGASFFINAGGAAGGTVTFGGFTLGPTTHSFTLGSLTLRAKAVGAATVGAAVTLASSEPPGSVTVTPRDLSVTIQ
jgi:hypothetical protein